MFAPGAESALYFGLDVLAELVKVWKKDCCFVSLIFENENQRHVPDTPDTEGTLESAPAALQVIVGRLPALQVR